MNDNSLPKAPPELRQAQWLANIADNAVRIPVIGIKLGLDFLVGLIPVIGDFAMTIVGLRIIHLAHKVDAPKSLKSKMLRNTVFDFLIGLVPFLGDVADAFYKSNQRNVRLLEQWWVTKHHQQLQKGTHHVLERWSEDQNIKQD